MRSPSRRPWRRGRIEEFSFPCLLRRGKAVLYFMKENRIEEGRFTEHAHGLGTVTQKMVWQRAREIALINGRSENNILEADLEQARRELTGRERLNPQATPAEEIPEERRWEEVPESTGQQAPTVAAPDEQTFAEKLVEEGVEEAEHDQMVEATRASLKREQQ
jgi:hypothetical protein